MICHKIYSLPDIEMYGGDTTSWEISLVREDGTVFDISTNTDCTCTLTLRPYGVKSAVSNVNVVRPIWTHIGTIYNDTARDKTYIRFDFSPEDTIDLRGKFVYQVDVRFGTEVRICQGVLNIKQNINTI
jgi:hypothetical protein